MKPVHIERNLFSSLLGRQVTSTSDLESITKDEVQKALNISPDVTATAIALQNETIIIELSNRRNQ